MQKGLRQNLIKKGTESAMVETAKMYIPVGVKLGSAALDAATLGILGTAATWSVHKLARMASGERDIKRYYPHLGEVRMIVKTSPMKGGWRRIQEIKEITVIKPNQRYKEAKQFQDMQTNMLKRQIKAQEEMRKRYAKEMRRRMRGRYAG